MPLNQTVHFSESNETVANVKIDVWVHGNHRGQIVVGGEVRSYVVENLNHGDVVWVEATYVDVAGNEAKGERLVFTATDSIPPLAPVVTLGSVEQV